jgi:1-acyl-sn-glycerol-3-phosphate acyltransferase
MTFIRQILFNIAFYGFTTLICIAYVPLLPLPRRVFVKALQFYFEMVHQIEKYVLGLDFEVRGREYIPEGGAFLVGAKHYSAYETMKLHLLFKDPAIILKKELVRIPLWGWHALKADMIAIDRSSGESAITSIVNGAKHIKEQGRPLVIFPQGTRVSLDETTARRPYKGGIARMYEATDLPIVPLALNSGIYWPKNAFFKKPGTVIFEFLPPIPPGLPPAEAVSRLQEQVEEASARLVQEAQESL